jgi:hypothetical protein
MNKIPINWPGFNWEAGQPVISDFIEGLLRQVNEAVGRIFEAELNGDVERMLGRGAYERAGKGTGRVSAGRCPKCGSDYRADRVRNGYRTRHLLTAEWGELVVGVPRVWGKCTGELSTVACLSALFCRCGTDHPPIGSRWLEPASDPSPLERALEQFGRLAHD